MDIKIKSRNGTILKTKDKVLYEDINISIDQDLFEHSTEAEDGLITRTIKKYYNDRISSIGDRAFKEWPDIEEVDFPNVETIGTIVFYGASGLIKINLPKVTTIGSQCFHGCSNLMNMNLNLVKTFTDSSFRSCTKIKWIYSSQVESITGPCFADCSNLTALVIASNTVAKLNASNAFVRTPIADGTGYIYVKDELIEQYKEATNWSAHAAQIKGLSELPEEVKTEINI